MRILPIRQCYGRATRPPLRGRLRLRDDSGQAVAEAPIAIIALVALVILLLQPTILLYDRVIMNNAVAEAARVQVTEMDGGAQRGHLAAFVERRLRTIPNNPYFRNAKPTVTPIEAGDYVGVKLTLSVRPLPVLGPAMSWLGKRGPSGEILIESQALAPRAFTGEDQLDPERTTWSWW